MRIGNYDIILASNSPRRRQLLKGLDIDFEVRVLPDIAEDYPPGLAAKDIPLYVSKEKAAAYRNMLSDSQLLITADTMVIADSKALGKPHSDEEAHAMLRTLSGRTHDVVTGVALTTKRHQKAFAVSTEVTFKQLTDEEINYYIEKYHPYDKAGAYGIQEWIGYVGVTAIRGSYFNVMGLPVQRIWEELKNFRREDSLMQ